MGRTRTHQVNRDDLFATEGIKDPSPSAPKQISSHEGRHVLPKDLPNAVRHLSDEELDRLLAVSLAEAERRGRHTSQAKISIPSRTLESVRLTRGQLNTVLAAFHAGITPARIARQFGLSQSDVKKAVKFDKRE